jgi:hypothetical protein
VERGVLRYGAFFSGVALRASNSPATCTAFSVADFQRMCFIITQDEKVHCALIASGQNLSRGQLDAGVRRDDFWCTTFATRYNDAAIKPSFSEILFSASESIDGETKTSSMKPSAHCSLNVTDAGLSLVKCTQRHFQTFCPLGLEEDPAMMDRKQ